MNRMTLWLVVIVLITAFCVWVSLPETTGFQLDTNGDGEPNISLVVRQSLGLDLVGGQRVLLEAELPEGSYTADDLRETANNVARRVNALGVTEPLIQVQGTSRILVELPGISDPQQAVDTIRQTALLEFVNFSGLGGQLDRFIGQRILTTQQVIIRDQRRSGGSEGVPAADDRLINPLTGLPFETVMTGSGLQAAAAQFDPQSGWLIHFELTPDGSSVFGPYTAGNIGQPMAIVLDGEVLSAPVIRAQLDTGGVIEGGFTEDEAKQLAVQLRSGALPIPLRVVGSDSVGASLGQESVNLSVRAGIIGVFVALLFMLIYYRVPGIAADAALLVFIVLNLAAFKLIPVTLTLPAITGFLISIGTAVDGNILIFERIKEEIRRGSALDEALEAGFNRAWQSIRDSNLSTILICGVLFFFGQTPGATLVAGFAVTLALGLILNLFTAVFVTRVFLLLLAGLLRRQLQARAWLLGV